MRDEVIKLPGRGDGYAHARFLGTTGAGKTTRVPPALLAETTGEVWVLEPRRLAARLAARRVAAELGERLGETVGYQVRFEEISQIQFEFMLQSEAERR